MRTNKTNLHKNESGLVAILVSMIFIIILSLITTSFALLTRKEQRQALDRQLSTQAFYAAESGVNDAIENIVPTAGNQLCSETETATGRSSDLGDTFSYSCVLINKNPTSLEYSEVETTKSTIVRLQAGSNIQKIKISWQATSGSQNFAPSSGGNDFPQEDEIDDDDSFASATDGSSVLRASIFPVTGLNRASLTANAQTIFLYPREGATGTVAQRGYTTNQSDQGDIISGNCHEDKAPRYCSVEVINLPAASNFYLRLKSIYNKSNVVIQAFTSNGSSTPVALTGTQAKIDATGKASDVLRRIQVRVPIDSEYMYPEYAIESADDLCKLITTTLPNTVTDTACYTD